MRPRRRVIAEQRLTTGPRFIVQPHLLVIDEFGNRLLDEDGRSRLSEVINARYLKGPAITIPTSGSTDGASGWAMPCSPPPSSTGCCTAASSSATTARPAGCVPTRPSTSPVVRPEGALTVCNRSS
ncbi:hypothetical protein GBF35_29450 [Nonomuraea phyllanthi]|nr:hypothetical protein GBF35_29450 [Nonomuraea phyllanthi]